MLNEVKKLRGGKGTVIKRLKRLQQLRESGEIAEDAYLTLSSGLEEDLIQINVNKGASLPQGTGSGNL